MTIEQLLRDALDDEAASILAPPDRWAEVEAAAARGRRRHGVSRARARRAGGFTVLAVATAAAAALIALPALHHDAGRKVSVRPAGGTETTLATPLTTVTQAAPPTTTPAAEGSTAGSGYLPLYPFSSLQDADAWQTSYQRNGTAPWHLDPGQTSLSFAGFLGYSAIDNVISVQSDSTGDHVAIGYLLPNGATSTAAVVHLRRFGTGSTAPWEVVGTDDTSSFSVTSPRYAAVGGSPLSVGGADTAVDPNVRVEVLQLSTSAPLATACCWPGHGSTPTPGRWALPISYRGATDPVLVVAASNAGGLEQVGQFAVTGIRTTTGTTPGL